MDIVSSIVRSGGIAVVIIEHDMDIVFRYSERIVVMHQGSVLADGTPDQIRQNEVVTSTLLGASETADAPFASSDHAGS
jgi:branched-chain amino acid transport system ATP-binding protein